MNKIIENILPMPDIPMSVLRRFWSKVDRRSDSECWNWLGVVNNQGYGSIWINNQSYRVHRIAYYIYYKKDPNTFLICHSCNNKSCVNPKHLSLGTHSDNNQYAYDTNMNTQLGEIHPLSKLTENDIHEIRELCNIASQRQVAKLFNVSHTAIRRIIIGKTWSHI